MYTWLDAIKFTSRCHAFHSFLTHLFDKFILYEHEIAYTDWRYIDAPRVSWLDTGKSNQMKTEMQYQYMALMIWLVERRRWLCSFTCDRTVYHMIAPVPDGQSLSTWSYIFTYITSITQELTIQTQLIQAIQSPANILWNIRYVT